MATIIEKIDDQYRIVLLNEMFFVQHEQEILLNYGHLEIGENWIGGDIQPILFENEAEMNEFIESNNLQFSLDNNAEINEKL